MAHIFICKIYAIFNVSKMIYEYIISCYRLLLGMLQVRNFMSFVIMNMCILSRFFAIMCRINSLMGNFYNLWMKENQFPLKNNESSSNISSLINLPQSVKCQSYLRWGKRVEKSKLSRLLSGNHQIDPNQKEEEEKKMVVCDEEELGEPVEMD